ncbi:MAG TPA: hypothetical protein VN922_16870, partial [Bacteroidia bacterium]|nr:hypothetical protein [Bacteroidia bacterium]
SPLDNCLHNMVKEILFNLALLDDRSAMTFGYVSIIVRKLSGFLFARLACSLNDFTQLASHPSTIN